MKREQSEIAKRCIRGALLLRAVYNTIRRHEYQADRIDCRAVYGTQP